MVLGLYWLFLGASFIMLAAALIGWLQGQPYAVWYGLGLAGLIGTLVLGANYYTLRVAYRQAEQRRLEAENLG
jgi:multidrug transporter EmrE-like cation transporter